MNKHTAIQLLGGTTTEAARQVGISVSAVSQWPDILPKRIEDRVLAVLARLHLPPEMLSAVQAPPQAPGVATSPAA